MIRAMIFDFNGVIADDETPHVTCFQRALSEFGLMLSVEDYYGTYLGMDERTCTTMLLSARDGSCADSLVQRIIARKTELFRAATAEHKPKLFSGVIEFVKAAEIATDWPLRPAGDATKSTRLSPGLRSNRILN